jgi:hypothetical protein
MMANRRLPGATPFYAASRAAVLPMSGWWIKANQNGLLGPLLVVA